MLAVVYVSDFFFITCSGLILFWVLLFEQRFAQSLQPRCTEEWHLGTPPPFPNLYILLHNLLYDHSIVQPHITVRSTVEGALAVSCCRMGWGWGGIQWSLREAQIFALYVVFPCLPSLFFLVLDPISMMVSPHRSPPEQPGESPCIHRHSSATFWQSHK